ncbi:unnamed protein product [Pieris macdunnoughi]|uniref:Uncharacterized protein n=1 Tax=Pieris macdunnoughi TaxID=345717 RepID=A0A821XFI2_9NEOP|nr:unnamed protein product [Pieris macdunnoughi]
MRTATSTARPDFTSRGEDAGIGFGAIPVTKIIGIASAPQKRDATRSLAVSGELTVGQDNFANGSIISTKKLNNQSASRAERGGDCIPTSLPRPRVLTPRPSGDGHVTRRLAAECATATKIEHTHAISNHVHLFYTLLELLLCLPK